MTQESEIDTFVINSLSEKFMDGQFFLYVVISETLHVKVNIGENVEN